MPVRWHSTPCADEAYQAVQLGIDAVVAQGIEAGGHVWGEIGTMVLVPVVVDIVPNAHVVAAGGIADGRGLAAALALGAGAAWVGTRLLLANECTAHSSYRQLIRQARETDTILSKAFDGGWPDAKHRCLDNPTLQAWRAAGYPAPGSRPGEGQTVAYDKARPIARYSLEDPIEGVTGDVTSMALYAGQSVGLVREERPVAEIVATMVAEASTILSRLGS